MELSQNIHTIMSHQAHAPHLSVSAVKSGLYNYKGELQLFIIAEKQSSIDISFITPFILIYLPLSILTYMYSSNFAICHAKINKSPPLFTEMTLI